MLAVVNGEPGMHRVHSFLNVVYIIYSVQYAWIFRPNWSVALERLYLIVSDVRG